VTEVRIGDLRHRVRIEARQRLPDDGGGARETWSLLDEVWAAIEPAGGAERVDADQLSGGVTHLIRMRAGGPAVQLDMRIVWGGRKFEIRSVIDVGERKQWTEISAEEREL